MVINEEKNLWGINRMLRGLGLFICIYASLSCCAQRQSLNCLRPLVELLPTIHEFPANGDELRGTCEIEIDYLLAHKLLYQVVNPIRLNDSDFDMADKSGGYKFYVKGLYEHNGLFMIWGMKDSISQLTLVSDITPDRAYPKSLLLSMDIGQRHKYDYKYANDTLSITAYLNFPTTEAEYKPIINEKYLLNSGFGFVGSNCEDMSGKVYVVNSSNDIFPRDTDELKEYLSLFENKTKISFSDEQEINLNEQEFCLTDEITEYRYSTVDLLLNYFQVCNHIKYTDGLELTCFRFGPFMISGHRCFILYCSNGFEQRYFLAIERDDAEFPEMLVIGGDDNGYQSIGFSRSDNIFRVYRYDAGGEVADIKTYILNDGIEMIESSGESDYEAFPFMSTYLPQGR